MLKKERNSLASAARRVCLGLGGTAVLLVVAAVASAQDQTPPPPASQSGTAVEEGLELPRDPFRPFTIDIGPLPDEASLTPLQRVDLGQLKLVGVVWQAAARRAMVEDDAGLGYILQSGTPIGRRGGVVTLIEPGRVVVQEPYVDFYGERQSREVVLELRPEEEGT